MCCGVKVNDSKINNVIFILKFIIFYVCDFLVVISFLGFNLCWYSEILFVFGL